MIVNTTIAAAAYLAFDGSGAWWGYLMLFAIVADCINILTKPISVKIPVVGVMDKKHDNGAYL